MVYLSSMTIRWRLLSGMRKTRNLSGSSTSSPTFSILSPYGKYDPSTKRDVSISFWDKEKVDALLLGQGIEVKNKIGYDHVYVANMARADFYKSSIKDEEQLAQFIKDMVDDADQKDGFIFNRFYADCCHNGVPIPWEDVL